MKKELFIGFGFLLVCLFALIIELNKLTTEIKKENSYYESKIGTYFKTENDSIMIVDYSFLSKTFTLSNGTKINYKLVNND